MSGTMPLHHPDNSHHIPPRHTPPSQLSSKVKKGDWTAEEDALVFESVSELGTKWSEIAKRFTGRTDNAIKNHYNSEMKKEARLSNDTIKNRYNSEMKKEARLSDNAIKNRYDSEVRKQVRLQ